MPRSPQCFTDSGHLSIPPPNSRLAASSTPSYLPLARGSLGHRGSFPSPPHPIPPRRGDQGGSIPILPLQQRRGSTPIPDLLPIPPPISGLAASSTPSYLPLPGGVLVIVARLPPHPTLSPLAGGTKGGRVFSCSPTASRLGTHSRPPPTSPLPGGVLVIVARFPPHPNHPPWQGGPRGVDSEPALQ